MLMEVVMAGFGGQGLMLIGKLLAEASMTEGKEVSWLPSYGPEMRGGTANCTVVVSDKPVASPVINMPLSLVAMNRPSLDKFGPQVKSGGLVLINSSLIDIGTGRHDVTEFFIEPNKEAMLEAFRAGDRFAETLRACGWDVQQREQFFVEPKREALEGAAAKA